ncbi:MAG TPA: lipopolysaccharide kinase InaA family protein, partial [Gemmataceae bacterium]
MPVSLRRNPPRPGRPRPAGWVVFHPRERDRLPGLAAADFLDLPGEVVSGHADRHVRRVALGGGPAARFAYLKREHRVRWGERLKNALAGFGWASKSRREARVLRELERAGLALAPHWLAYGEDGRGRAFLLVEEVPGGVELRRWLASAPAPRRRALAARLGKGLAALHRHGFDLPDLSAKHVLVDPETLEITLLDWQRARRRVPLPWPRRVSALAALHASTSEALAGPRERARMLCHYLKEL